jgi:hypothetical protein
MLGIPWLFPVPRAGGGGVGADLVGAEEVGWMGVGLLHVHSSSNESPMHTCISSKDNFLELL